MAKPAPQPTTDAAALSRMLFQAREHLSMWADVVTARTGQHDASLAALISEIDTYRTDQGWSADGFGGETDVVEGD